MNKDPKVRAKVIALSTKWYDQIEIRANHPYGSARYNRADAKAEQIENEASMLTFGDTKHTMSECVNGEEAE